jgi:ATP-dependent Clp protease, protease subunit
MELQMKFQFRLLQSSAAKPTYSIKNEDDEPTIYIYDAIGDWFGISAEAFAKDMNAIDKSTIHLRINSPGGDVFAAQAMAQIIRSHKAKVVAHIDGIAASAATTIALAADEVEMSAGAQFMIHNAWSIAMGDYREMSKVSDMLKKVNDVIAADYTRKTGKTAKEIGALMDEETWFNADEALANGFIDRIASTDKKTKNMWDLTGYNKAPAHLMTPDNSTDEVASVEHLQRHLKMLERIA